MTRPTFCLVRLIPAVTVVLPLSALLVGCTGTPEAGSVTQTVTVTATATIEARPDDPPSLAADEAGTARDAQFIVERICQVQAAYVEFEQLTGNLAANPDNYRQAKDLAAGVAFTIDGLSSRMAMGPSEGWTDPWLALRALQVADAVDGSRTYFESAARAESVDELISLVLGVLSDPIDFGGLGDLPGRLPAEQRDELLRCVGG